MDTIVYLSYRKSERADVSRECSYRFKEHQVQDYRLIKVRVEESTTEADCAKSSGEIHGKMFSFRSRLRYRRSLRQQEKKRREMSERLCQEIAALLQERDDIYLCYDESVSRASWVRQILPVPEFEGYLQREWVYRILPEACNHHFVVLGDVPYIREVLWELAPRLKSLLWILPDRTVEEELEDFSEEFYQETGLAIRFQFLPADTTYGQFGIPEYLVKEPVNILDFTEGKHIPRFYPPKGSVWLDMTSDLDKERRIRARGLACSLISLRKQWKNAPFA